MTDAAYILVVDDNPAGLYLKSHILGKAGHAVRQVETGRAALESCHAEAPHLVLLDVRLPDCNGIELARRIKTDCPGVTVLQTSAAATSARDRAMALEGGADAFLVEPIEPEELLATAKALLRMRRAEQQLRGLNDDLERQVAERTHELQDAGRRLQQEAAERRKAEVALWHAQKLEAVGQLTGGIAHDFNNLLAVIVGTLDMLGRNLESGGTLPPARLVRLVGTAQAAAERATKLTRQLLAFARRSSLHPEVANLGTLFAASRPLFLRALGEAVALRTSFAPGLWPCRVDPTLFESAMLNLLMNACDAMPRGGSITVDARNVLLDASDSSAVGEVPPGAHVCVEVTDTGSGMTADVAAHVFEPFFTTKEVGKGTGLGLSQVYGFVKQSGGGIALETTPGAGTTVRLYFPRVANESVAPVIAESHAATPTGSETVLVVEDDDLVRQMAVDTIGSLGYRVLSAANGPAALEVLQNDRSIDLLFSDVAMPGGMSGYDLVRAARRMRQGLKALVTSGYADRHPALTDTLDVPMLPKPYRRAELAEHIRAVLEGTALRPRRQVLRTSLSVADRG
jgi:signal transduction histidine kinase